MAEKIYKKQKWHPCERGSIANMVAGQNEVKRRQILKTVGTAAGLILIGGGLSCALLHEESEPGPPIRGTYMSCREVLVLMNSFNRNELESELTARIAKHLNLCRKCYKHFHEHRDMVA